jgi:hypothetical protein
MANFLQSFGQKLLCASQVGCLNVDMAEPGSHHEALYLCSYSTIGNNLCSVDLADFSHITLWGSTPGGYNGPPLDIGGDGEVVWIATREGTDRHLQFVYELTPSFSVVKRHAMPDWATDPIWWINGDRDVVWVQSGSGLYLWRRNPWQQLGVIVSGLEIPGGCRNVIWAADATIFYDPSYHPVVRRCHPQNALTMTRAQPDGVAIVGKRVIGIAGGSRAVWLMVGDRTALHPQNRWGRHIFELSAPVGDSVIRSSPVPPHSTPGYAYQWNGIGGK